MREMPHLQGLRAKLQERGFEVLGISLDTKLEALEETLAAGTMEWPQVFDGKKFAGPLAKAFGVRRIPFTLLVDARGIVRYAGLRGANLERLVMELREEAVGQQ